VVNGLQPDHSIDGPRNQSGIVRDCQLAPARPAVNATGERTFSVHRRIVVRSADHSVRRFSVHRPHRTALIAAVVLSFLAATAGLANDLCRLVRLNDHHAVRTALEGPEPPLSQLDAWGYTPLHWAGILDRPRLAAQLLAAGAPVTVLGGDGGSPLHWLCHHDHPDLVRGMLAAGADANLANRWGRTPLHVAVRRGCAASVAALLDAGSDVDAATAEGWTPLHVANLSGRRSMVDLLVKSGADRDRRDAEGHTPAELWRARRRPVTLPSDAMEQYLGHYAVSPHLNLVVWLADGDLCVQEFAPDHLVSVAPDTFQCLAEPWQLVFTRDDDGLVDGVSVDYLRRTVTAERKSTPAYVGSNACRACHTDTWFTWARSRHGLAYQRLHTDWALALAHLRPHFQDVTAPAIDGRCRQCHITGELAPPRVAAESWRQTEGVGCEACHGPGSRHVALEEPMPGGDDCASCHRRNFARDEAWPLIAHGLSDED